MRMSMSDKLFLFLQLLGEQGHETSRQGGIRVFESKVFAQASRTVEMGEFVPSSFRKRRKDRSANDSWSIQRMHQLSL